jgi:hypothetical protein
MHEALGSIPSTANKMKQKSLGSPAFQLCHHCLEPSRLTSMTSCILPNELRWCFWENISPGWGLPDCLKPEVMTRNGSCLQPLSAGVICYAVKHNNHNNKSTETSIPYQTNGRENLRRESKADWARLRKKQLYGVETRELAGAMGTSAQVQTAQVWLLQGNRDFYAPQEEPGPGALALPVLRRLRLIGRTCCLGPYLGHSWTGGRSLKLFRLPSCWLRAQTHSLFALSGKFQTEILVSTGVELVGTLRQ